MNQTDYASEERLYDEVHPDDPRVQGGDNFLSSLPVPRIRARSGLTLDQLIAEEWELHAVPLEAIRSAAKHPRLSKVRAAIAAARP